MKYAVLLILQFALAQLLVLGQSIPLNPYRNFIGDWSGVIEVNQDSMPSTLTLHIAEEVEKHRMRWDYVFGKPGEKGYTQTTKWVELKPAKEEMKTKWKSYEPVELKTINLNKFNDNGYGTFVAVVRRAPQRCTYDLSATTLDYLWETSDGKTITVYSKFHLTRDLTDVSRHP